MVARVSDFREAGYQMPANLRLVLSNDPTGDEWAAFAAATAFSRAGFRVLPCEPGRKEPLTIQHFLNGALSATSDYETVRDAFLAHPDANVGLAPGPDWVVVDIDPRNGGSLERAEELGLDVNGYRERTGSGGWHIPMAMPSGVVAEKSMVVADGIEIKGPGSFVVSPHSKLAGGSWYGPEAKRDVWAWGIIPATWEHLPKLMRRRAVLSGVAVTLRSDEDAARNVLDRLLSGSQSAGIRSLFWGDWSRHYPDTTDTSESMRDFLLVLAGSHFLRDHPRAENVLAALLWQTGWPQSKLRRTRKPCPEQYVVITVAKALATRAEKDRSRIHRLSLANCSRRDDANTVFDAKVGMRRPSRATIIKFICAFASVSEVDCYDRGDGWRRLPVEDVARVHGVSRETVRLALKDAEQLGLIERDVVTVRHDGKPRTDSLVRIAQGSIPGSDGFGAGGQLAQREHGTLTTGARGKV